MSEIFESVDTTPATPPPPPAAAPATTSTSHATTTPPPSPSSSSATSPTSLESSSNAHATAPSSPQPPLGSALPTSLTEADEANKDGQLESEPDKEQFVALECKKAEDSVAATAVEADGGQEKLMPAECKMAEESLTATAAVDDVVCAVDGKEKLVSSECKEEEEVVVAPLVVDEEACAVEEEKKFISSECKKAEEAAAATADVVVGDVACAVDEKLKLQVEDLTTTSAEFPSSTSAATAEAPNLTTSTTVSDDNSTLSNNAPVTENTTPAANTTQIPAATSSTSTAASTPTTDSTVPTTADTTLSFTPSPALTPDERRVSVVEKKCNFLRQFRSGSSSSGFKKFTASQFMEVWNHYDTDGNGYIEDHELDGFLREFVLSSVSENDNRPEILSDAAMSLFKETFMDAFDENQDGMIDISELAEILPTDENFLLLFHLKNPLQSSVEFMKIWRLYDKDCLGFIESKQLKSFLKHILDNQKTTVSEDKLNEYTETILNLFDSNRDGKLQLSEMARLMPVKQNFLSKPILKGAGCLTRRDIDKLFRIYDQNRNGTIEDEELTGLLKDIMDLGQKDYTLDDINKMKKIIMDHWDQDHDGTISKSELRMFLIQQCKISAESQGLPYNDEGGSDDDDDYD